MKKQDYSQLCLQLAHAIKRERATLSDSTAEENQKICARGALCALSNLAQQLAEYLHVDRAKFLQACGLKP